MDHRRNLEREYGVRPDQVVEAAAAQMIKLPFNSPFATIAGPAAKLAKVQHRPHVSFVVPADTCIRVPVALRWSRSVRRVISITYFLSLVRQAWYDIY